jgi:DNA-binding response OmpR family regulator
MPLVLICSQSDLEAELSGTPLWRADIERHLASRVEEAQMLAVASRPDLVAVDRDLPRAARLVSALREEAATRRASIVVLARGDFDPLEVELLEAGANAVLRLPPGPEWEARLRVLLAVPVRRQARLAVHLQVEGFRAGGVPVEGIALDLSQTGMLLEVRAPLHPGDDLDLRFRTPDRSLIEAHARVVRQAGAVRFGVQFAGLGSSERERIRRFVETSPPA